MPSLSSLWCFTSSPYAHAETTGPVGLNDPFTDAIQLWSAALSSLDSLAHQIASALQLHQALTFNRAAKSHAPNTLQQPAAFAAAAALATEFPPETATTSASQPETTITSQQQPASNSPEEATSDQTTQSPFVKSAVSAPLSKSPEVSQSSPSPPTPATNFITQDQFNAALSLLGTSLRQLISQSASNPIVSGAGAPLSVEAFAPSQRIDQLNNVTITNANLTASEIPTDITASNYLPLAGGTLSGDLTVGGNFTAGSISFAAASSTGVIAQNATTTNLVATNATSTKLFASLGNFTTGIFNTLSASIANITGLIAVCGGRARIRYILALL